MTVYAPTKSLALRLLRVPEGPPEAPVGSHESVRIFRPSPRYLRYRLFQLAVGLVPTLAIEAFAVVGVLGGLGIAGLPVAFAIALLFVVSVAVGVFGRRVEYDVRHYVMTDRSLRVRTGAWTVREMTLTYANVQNLTVQQGPLQRFFGIADVAVDTAGGGGAAAQGAGHDSGHRVVIAGIEDPTEVRDAILAHLRKHALGTGLGDPDDVSRTASAAPVPALAGPEFLAALRDVRDAARALRTAATARVGDAAV